MSDYHERVYEVVSSIPEGKVTTYGAIARYLGVASAHRVVNRNGELTGRGHFPDDTMRERLQQEGVRFSEDYRVDLSEYMWDPSLYLREN
ncbi:MGMT family protein [Fodinibius sediminis]|uniref:Methylated-DNA-protein-cysteine methyltransferase related protein n=1 Tax=Fodinibius sediminis TaxID=1214077 RepID=A0A521B0E4_9BACT|nr:MGMT family protein [Fodinibius sediminis]SMO40495.1 methylated-DNA-protein-cysteine methyltransferase related protein [Fodinibius sediminis]